VWELLLVIGRLGDQAPDDGWTKISDVHPIINTTYFKLRLPVCPMARLTNLLGWCQSKGVVEVKSREFEGKKEDYVRPTADLALLRMYVDIAQPLVTPADIVIVPLKAPPALPWWKPDDKGSYPPGSPTSDDREKFASIIERFTNGGNIAAKLRSNVNW
jgi:hypothetical protein